LKFVIFPLSLTWIGLDNWCFDCFRDLFYKPESAGGTMTALTIVTMPNVAKVSRTKAFDASDIFVRRLLKFAITTSFRVNRHKIDLATATTRRLSKGSTGHSPARTLRLHYSPRPARFPWLGLGRSRARMGFLTQQHCSITVARGRGEMRNRGICGRSPLLALRALRGGDREWEGVAKEAGERAGGGICQIEKKTTRSGEARVRCRWGDMVKCCGWSSDQAATFLTPSAN
jgi:hypothetical protein